MRIGRACLRMTCAFLQHAMLDVASTTIDTDSDALPEWSA